MPVRQGQMLSHYRLVEKIGEGGMGVVWKAVDTHLGREVALKILPDTLAHDPDGITRFEREARLLAGLNHPNVVTIHAVEEELGIRFFAMELVDGQPLTRIIAAGSLALGRILDIGIALASALSAAHKQGVVHRDLKPANVMITSERAVKVLDFGLAKFRPLPDAGSTSETVTKALTTQGQLVGTFPYMSPEQLQGEVVDCRSDIFSLGVVLYELATGTRPFRGSTGPELMSSIFRDTPPSVDAVRTDLPPALGRLIRRCLEKEPARRWQSALDVRNELEDIRAESNQQPSISPTAGAAWAATARRLRWQLVAALVGGAGCVALLAILMYPWIREQFLGRPVGEIRSLAVLPLDNLMGDPAQDYFVDGMHDALISEVAKTGLRVISRTSVMRYRSKNKPLPQIAQELGVDALIEGSVLRVGDQVRVTAQLIHGSTDQHLWADSYQRSLADALAVLGEVTRAIAAQVKITLTPAQQAQLAAKRAVNPAAQEAYLRGRHEMQKMTREGRKSAIDFFQKAIELDPGFARGHCGIAQAHLVEFMLSARTRTPELSREMRAHVGRALELDPELALAHAIQGTIRLYMDWDWKGAEEELRRAIMLNPSEASVYHPLGDVLLVQGRLEESLEVVRKGAQLDPFAPGVVFPVAGHLSFLGRYEEVIKEMRGFRKRFAQFGLGSGIIVDAYWQTGRYDQALAEYRARWKDDPELLNTLEAAYARNGPRAAMKAVGDLQAERARTGPIGATEIAYYYALGGEVDRALQWLEQAYREHDPFMAHLKADRTYDVLRSDPRFQDLLRRMNFPSP